MQDSKTSEMTENHENTFTFTINSCCSDFKVQVELEQGKRNLAEEKTQELYLHLSDDEDEEEQKKKVIPKPLRLVQQPEPNLF